MTFEEICMEATVRVANEAARDFILRVADMPDKDLERFMDATLALLAECVEHMLEELGADKAAAAAGRETAMDAFVDELVRLDGKMPASDRSSQPAFGRG